MQKERKWDNEEGRSEGSEVLLRHNGAEKNKCTRKLISEKSSSAQFNKHEITHYLLLHCLKTFTWKINWDWTTQTEPLPVSRGLRTKRRNAANPFKSERLRGISYEMGSVILFGQVKHIKTCRKRIKDEYTPGVCIPEYTLGNCSRNHNCMSSHIAKVHTSKGGTNKIKINKNLIYNFFLGKITYSATLSSQMDNNKWKIYIYFFIIYTS